MECVFDDLVDEHWRCVERAGAMAFVGVHEAFEGAAQHFWVDGGFGPCGRVFVCGEAVAIEDIADECGECVVGEAEGAAFLFEWCWCEESAVEEWDVAEGAGGWCALAEWGVECAEEEWFEEALVEVSAGFELVSGLFEEEVAVAIQPTFCLEEGEEQAA